MIILSCDASDDKIYTLTMKLDSGIIEKVSFIKDGLYSICYASGKDLVARNGRVLKVVYSNSNRDRYILFDSSEDNMNRRERIYFNQIKSIKDITPIDSYRIAVQHGFKGSVEEWLESLKGRTPEAGVDFWTEEEKNEFKDDIVERVKSEIGSDNEEINEAIDYIKENIDEIRGIKEESEKLVQEANQAINNIREEIKNKPDAYLVERLEGESDEEAIERILDGKEPSINDSVVIKTFSEEDLKYTYISYRYIDSWIATVGDSDSVNSDNVVMDKDITYIDENGNTETISTEGKSISDIITILLTKEINPTIEEPKVTITLVNAGEKEVGTTFTPIYSAELFPGSYSYGPETGIEALEWEITDSNGNTSTNPSGSFEPFVVNDNTEYTITARATHGTGRVPVTNLNNEYPDGQIIAGVKSSTSKKITGYRTFFYGANAEPIELTSDSIRANLTNGGRTIPNSFNIAIPEGTTQVVIALFDKSIESIIDTKAFGINILSRFELLEIPIEGFSGYSSKPYKIYIYNPSTELGFNNYKVTIK